MRKELLISLFLLFAVSTALDCNVTLPRLLIGNKYSKIQSPETALILFDTKEDCSEVAQLILDENKPFDYISKPAILQDVNDELSHNGNNKEKVVYHKYTMVFSIRADVQQEYKVGFQGNKTDNSTIFSQTYTFKLPRLGAQNTTQKNQGIKFMFYGDQDLTERGNNTLNYLLSNTAKNQFDSFIFLGDYAYEFYQNNGIKGDQYLEKFAPLSFSYPLVMTPGNHEDNLNFTLFNEKFLMPDFSLTNLNNYNSFNMGNVHFVHINLHFYSITNQEQQAKMLAWLKKDLASVQKSITPWIIAVGHKLIYCYDPLTKDNKECVGYAQQFDIFSQILNNYGVDLFVVGHEHYNQVMAPIANQEVQDYTLNPQTNVIVKKQGFITIIQGNGGCVTSPTPTPTPSKSRMLADVPATLKNASIFLDEAHTGFGYIEVVNATYLEYTSYDVQNDKPLVKFGILSTHKSQDTSSLILSTLSFIAISLLFIAF